MSFPRKTVLAAAATVAFALPAAASTTFDSALGSGFFAPALRLDGEASGLQRDALTRTLETIGQSSETGWADAQTPKARELQAPGDGPRQSNPAQRNPLSASLRGDSDLFLWNLVAIVRAQQIDRTFDLVQTSLTVFSPAPSVVSPVPLPGALWLLGAGLLGLAASGRRRLAARSQRAGAAAFAVA